MDVGAFYYMKPGTKEIVEGVFGMMPANGIGLSPDENTVYVAETPTARLWSFDLSAPGEVKPRDVIYRGERGKPVAGLGGYQMFDSLAVEAGGNVCVATLISGCISVIAPDGTLVEQVPTGDRVTTNIAFGGPELKTAYITLSSKGELIAMDWARAGLPLNFLNSENLNECTIHVIAAGDAKQSMLQHRERMDCFVAYAPRNDGRHGVYALA